MGGVHLAYLTSLIVKPLKEVIEACKIETSILYNECLKYARRKYLLIDLTPIIIKLSMEVSML
jgi:hypothetical protein